jgi:Vitamin B6 photo-protection and homoeostasis
MKILSIVVIVLSCLHDAKCLASPSSTPPRIVSVKKNGGESRIFDPSPHLVRTKATPEVSTRVLVQKLVSAVRSTFLPSGYPSRTPPGYLRYCMFSWIQDTSTQLRSVLATQRVLEGVGVGREGATALSALMNFLVRDGCGMGATLLFTSAASTRFRTDVKRWRLFADLMVDLGITLEIMAVLVPPAFFLPMISVGNMCKAMCGVAAGACGGSINLHWAKGSDISDINAKFGAQHTVTGALGLFVAAFFARSVNSVNTIVLWALYTTLTVAHLVANTSCMRLIAFDACNTLRMNMLLTEFFEWWYINNGRDGTELPRLSSPEQIASREPLFFGRVSKEAQGPSSTAIRMGVSFDEFWKAGSRESGDPNELQYSQTAKDNYLVTAPSAGGSAHSTVALLSDVTGRQEAKALFHATWLATGRTDDSNELSRAWNCFETCMMVSGWDISKTELATRGYEVKFES